MARLLAGLRISVKLDRFELLIVLLVTVFGLAALLLIGMRLQSFAPTPHCQELVWRGYSSEDLRGCPGLLEFVQFDTSFTSNAMVAMSVAPFAIGTLLGSPVVAREIDTGTSELAWSLTVSRTRWLVGRLLPLLSAVLLASLLLGFGAEWLEHVRFSVVPAAESFRDYGSRGPLLAARAVTAFSIGILVGTVMGRTVPALVLTAIASVVVYFALSTAALALQPLDPVSTSQAQGDIGVLNVRLAWRTPGGQVLSDEQARQTIPASSSDPEAAILWLNEHYQGVSMIIPGTRMPRMAWTESVLHGAVVLLTFGASLILVQRRRPF